MENIVIDDSFLTKFLEKLYADCSRKKLYLQTYDQQHDLN